MFTISRREEPLEVLIYYRIRRQTSNRGQSEVRRILITDTRISVPQGTSERITKHGLSTIPYNLCCQIMTFLCLLVSRPFSVRVVPCFVRTPMFRVREILETESSRSKSSHLINVSLLPSEVHVRIH